jgi:hypothetical protein
MYFSCPPVNYVLSADLLEGDSGKIAIHLHDEKKKIPKQRNSAN